MKTVYRIIAPIISIAIFPVLYFLPMFRIMITSALTSGETKTNLLTSFTGLKEFISFSDIVKISGGDSSQFDMIKSIFSNIKEETKEKFFGDSKCVEWLTAAGVFFCIFLVLLLAFAVVSAITKKHIPSLVISICAFFTLIATNGCFNKFANPFITGKVGIASLLNAGNTQLSGLIGRLLSVDYLQLSVAYTFSLLLIVVIIIGTLVAVFDEYYAKA